MWGLIKVDKTKRGRERSLKFLSYQKCNKILELYLSVRFNSVKSKVEVEQTPNIDTVKERVKD